jgi:hypothetical protein
MSASQELILYAKRHFVDGAQFLRSASITDQFFRDLVGAHALPSPIYKVWSNGSFWSPIGGQVGTPTGQASEWFSPAATWWARRAKVLAVEHGLSPEQIASTLRHFFCGDFDETVRRQDGAKFGYPELTLDDGLDHGRMQAVAIAEWKDWVDGGYGVCLKRFDAFHLVAKTNESARIRHITADGQKDVLSPKETLELLNALDKLDAVMLPFAPHQRPFGTPGKWVDYIMAKYRLGSIPLVQHGSFQDSLNRPERYCA